MLVLPIRQRANGGDNEDGPERVEALGNGGRQLLLEALTGSLSTETSPEKDRTVRVTVKNTFIECEGVDDEGNEDGTSNSLHDRGAKTCSARLSSPTPSSILPGHITDEMGTPLIAPGGAEAPGEDPTDHSGSNNNNNQNNSNNTTNSKRTATLREPELDAETIATSSVNAPSSTHLPVDLSRNSNFGREVLQYALGFSGTGVVRYGGGGGGGSDEEGEADDDVKVRVKNTFIEIEREYSPTNYRGARSCTARLAAAQPHLLLSSDMAATMEATPGVLVAPSIRVTPAAPMQASSGIGAPSPGSALHGQFDADGQPLCQPCAWFYKGSGCQNGQSCRRCHLCPEGELKIRKKQKIARLRGQEASHSQIGSPAQSSTSPHKGASSGQPSPSSVSPVASSGHHSSNVSPASARWADIEEDKEDGEQKRRSAQRLIKQAGQAQGVRGAARPVVLSP